MTMPLLDGIAWLLLSLVPLLFIQPRLHHEMQTLFLLITRRIDVTMIVFSVLFLPGILLHEASHYLMARLLRVYTGRFSILPSDLRDGRLQLGFVEIGKAGLLRESLIGAAPLLVGGSFVAYAGLIQLEFDTLWVIIAQGDAAALVDALIILPHQPDFWLWLYLTIIVSSTMMPSSTDRRAWGSLGLILGVLLVIAIWAGAGGWLLENLAPGLNRTFRAMAVVFGVAVVVHVLLLFPVVLLKRLVSSVTGVEVVQKSAPKS